MQLLVAFPAAGTCQCCFPRVPRLPIALISNDFSPSRLSKVLQKMNIYSYRQTCALNPASAVEQL